MERTRGPSAGLARRVSEQQLVNRPRLQARLAGAVALITTSAGYAAVTTGSLVVLDDPVATAHNIANHELMFRLAVVGDVVALLYIVYTLLLFNLFRPVSRSLALLATFFSLVGIAMGAFNALLELAPLVVLQGSATFRGFTTEQLQSLALMFLQLHAQGGAMALVLFGAYNVLVGYLIYRSGFMPWVLGALLSISGAGYLVNSFATFLAPDFEAHLVPWILVPGLAELLVALWLLVFAVDARRWTARAAQAAVLPAV
jgi:hypothetical protein